jgi:geranylgeranyl diphosphate synthase type I
MTPTIQITLGRYQQEILSEMRRVIEQAQSQASIPGVADLSAYYGQMQYHLGWVDVSFSPVSSNPGKLLRPTLLLLSFEAASANGQYSAGQTHLFQALPAAVAIELTHNFTLIHDDIEDGDRERRHRATLWNIWGIPQAINTGDGMFALARQTLWQVVERGVNPAVAVRLGLALDCACLVLSEGQYLDISFERQTTVSVAMYIDMIRRKTGALMACAAEMGALLGTRENAVIERLRNFGQAMGVAFQVRDDLLGVWASAAESGKTPAGDIYRRKKSLPILHALEHANEQDRQRLLAIYTQSEPVTPEQVTTVLDIFARTETQAYCLAFLAEQCRLAHEALANVPATTGEISKRALEDMDRLVQFVEEASQT